MIALLAGVSGAWADPTVVTLANWDNNISNFGSFSETAGGSDYYAFTTTSGSYLAGVTLTSPNSDIKIANGGKVTTGYGYCMKFTSIDAASHTLQLSAPSGYVIESYVMALRSNSSSSGSFTVTAADGTSESSTIGDVNTSNSGYPILHVTNVESQTTTLTMQAQAADKILYVPYFSVVVRPSGEVNNVNKTFIYHQYVTLADNTMTTNAYAGLSGVTVTADGLTLSDTYVNNTYGQCIGVTASDTEEHTMTITAPEGYIVRGYTFFMKGSQGANPATYTAVDETSKSSTTGGVTMTVNNLTSRSTTIKVKFTVAASTTYFPRFFVNIQKRVDAINGISTSKSYNIYNNRGIWAVGSGASVVNSTSELSLGFMANDGKQKFAFIYHDSTDDDTDNGSYYLYSVSERKFAYVDGTKLSLTKCFTNDVATSPVTFESSTNATYKESSPVVVQVGGQSFGVSTGFSPDIYKYTPHLEDGGNAAAIYEVGDFDASGALEQIANTTTVEYHFIYEGTDKRNATVYALVGDELSIPSSLKWYGMAYESFYSDEECTSEITTVPVGGGIVYAKETWTVPIRYTATASAPEYYNLNIRSKYLVYDDEATGDVKLQNSSEPFSDDASWAFIGDPYTGFKLINKANGTNKYLTYTSVVTGSNSGNNNIQFVADGDFTDQYWYVDSNTGGICLRMKANTNIYFHHDNSYQFLRTCSSGEYGAVHNDAGSTIVASTDEEVLFALYNTLGAYSYGSAIGQYYSTDANVSNDDIISTLASINAAIQSSTTSAYPAAYAALVAISENIAFVIPSDGYYRLKNASTGKYLRVISDASGGVVADVEPANAASTPGTIVKIETSDGHQYYTCQSREFRQCYYSRPITATYGTHDKFALYSSKGIANQLAIAFAYGNGLDTWSAYVEGAYYAPNGDDIIEGGTSAAAAAQWIIEEAPSVTVNMHSDGAGNYYATFCAPFSYTVGDGTTAYTMEASGEWLVPTAVVGEVTAGTPVLLKGTSATATLTIGSSYAAAPVAGDLTGTYLAKTIEGASDYVLGIDGEGVVGFYHWDTNNLAANRAYIPAAASVKGYAINWDDVDAIKSLVDVKPENRVIYNLAGQRVDKLQRGVNIVNGKKVIVK